MNEDLNIHLHSDHDALKAKIILDLGQRALRQAQELSPAFLEKAKLAVKLPTNLALAEFDADFEQIHDQAKNILVYFWQPSTSLQDILKSLRFKDYPELDVTLSVHDFDAGQHRVLPKLAKDILADLEPCTRALISLARAKQLRITFGKVKEQMCPYFHVDRVSLRLLCTLRGPGTEWLDDAAVRRGALGKGFTQEVALASATVYQLGLWQVGLLKGERFPGARGGGIVHRSPAIQPGGEGRAFLRIDAKR